MQTYRTMSSPTSSEQALLSRQTAQKRPRLSYKMAVLIILFSSAIAIVTTFIQLAFDYRDNIGQIERNLDNIRFVHLPSLSLSLWELDQERLAVQLQGLESSPAIEYIQVEAEGRTVAWAGEARSQYVVRRNYDMNFLYRGERRRIGELQVTTSIDDIIDRLMKKFLIVLATNGAKTFLAAGFMLFLFQKIIGRHLDKIASFARERKATNRLKELRLERSASGPNQGDELDQVVEAINDYAREVERREVEREANEKNLLSAIEQVAQAARRAEYANKAKDEFLANMSHELRTPLNAIIGFSEILNGDANVDIPEDTRLEYAAIINKSGHHLLAVISEILDVAKVETGEFELQESRIQLSSALPEAATMIAPRAATAQVTLDLRPIDPKLSLRADATRFTQVLLNILTNAVKFTLPGGEVTVDAFCNQTGEIVIAIADTGVGIAKEDIPIALEPFGQVRQSPQQTHEGTGLGLSLARGLMERHGGSLELSSKPGDGTTVTLTFPAFRSVIAD